MTCKVSLCKSIHETLKHHLASVFAVCLLFFIKLITFFLQIQNYATDDYSHASDKEYLAEQLQKMTQPGYGTAILVMFIALFLTFDFFRYLHSKKQTDFFESLPIRRKDTFFIRILSACIVFTVPLIICFSFETILLAVFHFFRMTYFYNILWSLACMMLIFLAVLFTAVLAMIMTGHPIIALFGFGVFSGYFPILLQNIVPVYAEQYFTTYVSSNGYAHYLNYISPLGTAIKLLGANPYSLWNPKVHSTDFIAILIFILFVGVLSYILFQRRPSETAGRAMAFTKCNSVIRILLVIPLTLYIGLYLSQVASIGSKIWMVFGFIIATIVLHGIIESIFQFDIRGLWSHKKQLVGCFLATMVVAVIFWIDLFHYDEYLPAKDELKAITIDLGECYDRQQADGISGQYLDQAYQLAKNLVAQNNAIQSDDSKCPSMIQIKYQFKNGTIKERNYCVDLEANMELINTIYVSKEYKDDTCKLYKDDWNSINNLKLCDGHVEIALNLTKEAQNLLFETYLAELTPFTYSQKKDSSQVAYFMINKTGDSPYYEGYSCYIYPEFTKTIALLDKYIEKDESIRHFGPISKNPLEKYTIRSIDIFSEDYPQAISDPEIIAELKEHILLYDENSLKTTDYENFYEVQIELATSDGISYSHGVISKEIAERYKE